MSLRILLVDDHEVVRKGLAMLLLECPGYDVCGEAANGEDGVKRVLELKPDLVLLDVSMPKMNGIEATKLIRKVSPDTKIVILSMHDSGHFAQEAKLAGAHGFLTKACPLDELRSVIADVCGASRGQAPEMPLALGERNGNPVSVRISSPKQIIYRYDGLMSSDESELDSDGSIEVPKEMSTIQRHNKKWVVVMVTEMKGGQIPAYRVWLRSFDATHLSS